MHRLLASIFITVGCHVPALAADSSPPPFAPGAHKLQNGRPNELMVLGSSHLSRAVRIVATEGVLRAE
ncbi:MAG TPA: hypothetical protein VN089_09530 [Duganella sp.]|nr:hypothetical protein [Duganella sp.]